MPFAFSSTQSIDLSSSFGRLTPFIVFFRFGLGMFRELGFGRCALPSRPDRFLPPRAAAIPAAPRRAAPTAVAGPFAFCSTELSPPPAWDRELGFEPAVRRFAPADPAFDRDFALDLPFAAALDLLALERELADFDAPLLDLLEPRDRELGDRELEADLLDPPARDLDFGLVPFERLVVLFPEAPLLFPERLPPDFVCDFGFVLVCAMVNSFLDRQLLEPDLRAPLVGSEPFLLRLDDPLPLELERLEALRSVFDLTSPSSMVPRQPSSASSFISA